MVARPLHNVLCRFFPAKTVIIQMYSKALKRSKAQLSCAIEELIELTRKLKNIILSNRVGLKQGTRIISSRLVFSLNCIFLYSLFVQIFEMWLRPGGPLSRQGRGSPGQGRAR